VNEIDAAMSSPSAPITGATAAIAELPQIIRRDFQFGARNRVAILVVAAFFRIPGMSSCGIGIG
jgi:hypothetical protein